MSRLIALTFAWGLMAGAGTASAAVYVPGQYRDGIYTRPHFLDSPAVRYDREIKLDGEQGKLPKPTIDDQPALPEKLPPERAS
jgi:hypothetical protein